MKNVFQTTCFSKRQLGNVSLLWIAIVVSVFVYFLVFRENSNEAKQGTADPLAELSAEQISPLRPDGELADIFALGTRSTDLQRETRLAQIRGQVVQWTLPVYEVSRFGERYKIQTQGSDIAFLENKQPLLGTFVYLSSRNQQDSLVIAALKTGDLVTVKGRISGALLRNLVLDPAILVRQSLPSEASNIGTVELALPTTKDAKIEKRGTITSSHETRYGSITIVERKAGGDNYQVLFNGSKLDESDFERMLFVGKYSLREQDAILLNVISSNPRNGAEFEQFRLLAVRSKDDAKFIQISGRGEAFSIADGSTLEPKVVNGSLEMNLGFDNGLLRQAVFDGQVLSITSRRPKLDDVFPIPSHHCSNIFYVLEKYCPNIESCNVPKTGIQLLNMDQNVGHHPALRSAKFSELCKTVCDQKVKVSESDFRLEVCGIDRAPVP
jgi:hypothetical protein